MFVGIVVGVTMNNKKRGTKFEQDWCDYLSEHGYWAHFVEPKPDGSQPFDVIAAKDDKMYVYDCKTLKGNRFPLDRIEWNQRVAFARIGTIGGVKRQFIVIKNENGIYQIPFVLLIDKLVGEVPSINLKDYEDYCIERN